MCRRALSVDGSPSSCTLSGMSYSCIIVAFLLFAGATGAAQKARQEGAGRPEPLVIGDTFTIDSATLREVRRINVYAPPGYAESPDLRLPVSTLPDGGIAEDFLHVAGLIQVSVGNGTMRPFLLVGIENTERRRDMTGPTESAEDKKIAARVGGSGRLPGVYPYRVDAAREGAVSDDKRDGDRRGIARRPVRHRDLPP